MVIFSASSRGGGGDVGNGGGGDGGGDSGGGLEGRGGGGDGRGRSRGDDLEGDAHAAAGLPVGGGGGGTLGLVGLMVRLLGGGGAWRVGTEDEVLAEVVSGGLLCGLRWLMTAS